MLLKNALIDAPDGSVMDRCRWLNDALITIGTGGKTTQRACSTTGRLIS